MDTATETDTDTPLKDNAAAFLFKQEPMSKVAAQALDDLSKTETKKVQQIASNQIKLLTEFYDQSLSQAHRSFVWALIASGAGLLFFMVAIAFQLGKNTDVAIISAIGGALIEFIAAVNFYLYGKTTAQLNLFHGRLEVTQRFLLANSLCESLGDEYKDETRAQLIAQLAGGYSDDHSHERSQRNYRRRRPHERHNADEDEGSVQEARRHPAAANSD